MELDKRSPQRLQCQQHKQIKRGPQAYHRRRASKSLQRSTRSNDLTTLYNTASNLCTPYGSPIYQTFDLLRDLTKKHGYCFARNEWLADRLDCTTRTISNHITRLRDAGYISTERANNKRHVRIIDTPENLPPPPNKVTLQNGTKVYISSTRILPASIRDLSSNKQDRNEPGGKEISLVSALTAHGIRRETAQHLAETEPEQCRKQLADVESGRVNTSGIRDRAAWLIAAILTGYKRKKSKQLDRTATLPAEAFTRRPKRIQEPDPMEAEWKALPDAERRAIEIMIRASLSTILQRSQHVVRANCLAYLKNRNVTLRYDETTGAASSLASSAPSTPERVQGEKHQQDDQQRTKRPPQTGQPPPTP